MSKLNLKRTNKGWEEDSHPPGGGLVMTVSWEMIEALLRQSGRLRPSESVEQLEVEPYGVRLYLETE